MANTSYLTNAIADNIRFAKSRILLSPADATYNLVQLPRYSFVKSVWLQVVTAADVVPGACSIGWVGNQETAVTNGFMTMDVAEPTVTGLKRAQKDTLTTFEGKYFNAGSGLVTFTYAAGSATTKGEYRVFVEYVVIH